ncbi:MAG: hypothetical protein ACTSQI_12860 [Candidatus Helarchaeota archaeon]
MQIGFLNFEAELFQQLLNLAVKESIDNQAVQDVIFALTTFTNQLLHLPLNSTRFMVTAIEYEVFEKFYKSIHDEIPDEEIPLFQVAGTVNLKDPEVSGYVTFSLPKQFLEDLQKRYTLLEFLVIAAHERFERFLSKETIIARVYEKAREDYHEKWTLNKVENVEALLLYSLNKELIPLQETITYAVSFIVEHFLQTRFPWTAKISLPLVERDFNETARKISHHFFTKQFNDAETNHVGPDEARKRLLAGLNVLQKVTETFPYMCKTFLMLYQTAKPCSDNISYDFFHVISTTIQETLRTHGLQNLKFLYNKEMHQL